MGADAFVGDSEVVRCRQPLLFRAIFGVRLYFLVKYITSNGGDDFVGGDRTKAANRVSAHGEAAFGANIWVFLNFQRRFVLNARDKIPFATIFSLHITNNSDQIARPHITRTQADRARVNLRNTVDGGIAIKTNNCIGERRFNFTGQRVRLRHRVIHPLDNAERFHML